MIINTNKYIVSGLLGIALSASLTSCGDDFLDKNPKLSVTEHDIYASEQLIDATMTGVFTRFKNSSFAGGNISVIFDNRSDDLVNTGNNTLAHSDTYNFTVAQNSAMNPSFFQAGYQAINAANTLKEALEQRDNLPISEAKRQQYIANSLFIRDISWYYLAQVYSQPYAYDPNSKAIPVHTEAVTGPGYNDAPLWTIGQIYDQIITDLSSSVIAALPDNTGASFDPTIPSQAAAHMLLQRIYMAKGQWQEAISEGEQVTGFSLSSSVREMFDALHQHRARRGTAPSGQLYRQRSGLYRHPQHPYGYHHHSRISSGHRQSYPVHQGRPSHGPRNLV